ncbi:MAG: HAD hydrolase-like protein [Candidatus Poribacteria bacterium]|nr:HAD hydrolase-like protein [Candidatus Poribacteria bacterium]
MTQQEYTNDNIEVDYTRIVADTEESTRFLPGSPIEIIRSVNFTGPPEYALFDFDGTLSLIREGWMNVMIPVMVEVLRETGTGESREQLHNLVYKFVTELTGKQTIYQMIRLKEEVALRGGTPLDPLDYKREYHNRLMERINSRREGLRTGRTAPGEMLVPGSVELLNGLKRRDVQMYLASGTDEHYVREEALLLGIDSYFGENIYGAIDDYRSFSKAQVIRNILDNADVVPSKLVGFGDGYVEILNVKEAGGTAVGVASDESERSGKPDVWKRERLIGVGADLIIPDFRHHEDLIEYLWPSR